jgi:hypothetical protein
MISTELLAILACPACKADIEPDELESALRCVLCGRIYQVVDGIPNMMLEELPAE